MSGGWSVSHAAGVIGAQGDDGKGREINHGGKARTSQALWSLPTLRFEVIRHCGFPSRVTGGIQAERLWGGDIIPVTKGKRKGQL